MTLLFPSLLPLLHCPRAPPPLPPGPPSFFASVSLPSSGAVLDREADGTLELVITAEDHGMPEMTGSVTMTITLLDENDNAPTFIPQFGYAVEVAENTPVGSVLPVPVGGWQ